LIAATSIQQASNNPKQFYPRTMIMDDEAQDLEARMSEIWTDSLPGFIPPAPTKIAGEIIWHGRNGIPATAEVGGWPITPPSALQTKIRIRRYVDVHYLGHNNINDLDPNIAIGSRAGAERE
jgi:hypothetical protein